jgi:arylsulfatase A-like enzyme
VPLLIAGPQLPSRHETALALNIDLAPTLLELAGLPPSAAMHGRSLVPLLHEPAKKPRDVFVYECLDSYGGTHPTLAAISTEWSLIHTWETRADVGAAPPFVELYDLRTDPAQARNVADDPAHARIRGRLAKEIRQHIDRIGVTAVRGP